MYIRDNKDVKNKIFIYLCYDFNILHLFIYIKLYNYILCI